MIHVNDKSKCCGCSACAQACPRHCISMRADDEGFLYPQVDSSACIECGKCESVCPELNVSPAQEPCKVYEAKHPDEDIRMKSSSGGVFTLLATAVIESGGVVFGARFNEDWNVVHVFTETIDGLDAFRGSKYVQSNIGNSFRDAGRFLKAGRNVMFTGTPCQIAGLKRFLGKDYDNLLAVDVVCHGVPGEAVWQGYLHETLERECKGAVIKSVKFRDKRNGWKAYYVTIGYCDTKTGQEKTVISKYWENPYIQAFLSDLALRPSCYACPVRGGASCSDITIGDFWGIQEVAPKLDDDKGSTLLIVNNAEKLKFVNSIVNPGGTFRFSDVVKYNPNLVSSVAIQVNRNFFFSRLRKQGFYKALHKTTSTAIFYRIIRKLYRLL